MLPVPRRIDHNNFRPLVRERVALKVAQAGVVETIVSVCGENLDDRRVSIEKEGGRLCTSKAPKHRWRSEQNRACAG